MDQGASCERNRIDFADVGCLTFCLWIATFRLPKTLWAIFLTLWIAFFLLGAGDMGMGPAWRKAGGWDGILCGCLALYLSFAQVTNAVAGRTAIPVGEPSSAIENHPI